MHDIISDIIDWDQANKAYLIGEGQSGERYIQRLEAADRMAEIEARWHHLPGGFLSERKLIKTHIHAVAESTQAATNEEVCWLAIAAATAWIPNGNRLRRRCPASRPPCWAAFLLLRGSYRAADSRFAENSLLNPYPVALNRGEHRVGLVRQPARTHDPHGLRDDFADPLADAERGD
jgi:hypothetical protein